MSSVNITAFEKAIKAAWPSVPVVYLPLLQLIRALAHQVDASGAEGPSARLSASYLSALKDFARAVVATPPVAAKLRDPLEEFRATHLHAVPAGVAS